MSKQSFYAAFESNWPEDEAYALAMDAIETEMTEDEVAGHIKHIHSVFARETDGAKLIERFDAKFASLYVED